MKRFLHHIICGLIALSATTAMTSCSMMEDDVQDCPTGLYVRFVYDYNTARADMFKDHVGHVRLFVYDENGRKVAQRDVSNTDIDRPLLQYGYTIHFADGELPEGRYRLQAIALQKDWDEALATPGAKYRRNDPANHDELNVTLDRTDQRHPVSGHYHVSNEAPLDTLWHTLKVTATAPQDGTQVPVIAPTTKPFTVYPLADQMVTIQRERATYATVSMIRNTKHLNITLRQIDDPANIFDSDFEVYVTDRNSAVAHDNELSSDDPLHYTPYHNWTTAFDENGVVIDTTHKELPRRNAVQMRTAHYNVMFNRLINYTGTDMAKNGKLMIVNKHSGKTVAEINLPSILAEGRMAYYTYNYSPQEYLDREYDYHLNFFLKGDSWVYCDIVINTLGWSLRKQNEVLGGSSAAVSLK